MEIEVERGLDHPTGRSDAQRWRQHTLAQPRDHTRRALDACPQATPVGRLVVDGDGQDRRTKDRVLLDVPHERVLVAHVMRETRFGHRSSQRPGGYSPHVRRAAIAPSSGMTAPLMNAAAEEHRNATVALTSSARPSRPIGVPASTMRRTPSGSPDSSGNAREESRVGRGRRDHVDADAVGRVLDRGLLREVDERALRRAIGGVSGRADRAEHRTEQHDRAAAAVGHRGDAVLHARGTDP